MAAQPKIITNGQYIASVCSKIIRERMGNALVPIRTRTTLATAMPLIGSMYPNKDTRNTNAQIANAVICATGAKIIYVPNAKAAPKLVTEQHAQYVDMLKCWSRIRKETIVIPEYMRLMVAAADKRKAIVLAIMNASNIYLPLPASAGVPLLL